MRAILTQNRRLLLAVLVCALAAAATIVYLATRGHSDPAAAANVPSTPASTPPPAATPKPRPKPPAIEPVAPSAPIAFTMSGPKFTITTHVCSMANIIPYDPPGEQHHTICWVRSGFGVAPGTDRATSYLFGHSWAEDDQEVLNKLSSLATQQVLRGRTARFANVTYGAYASAPHTTTPAYPVRELEGYTIRLRTHTGLLTYKVTSAYGVAKNQLGYLATWQNQHVRNRIVLTTCAEYAGRDYEYNIVVEASLVAALPNKSA